MDNLNLITQINETLNDLFQFVDTDKFLNTDFQNYLTSSGYNSIGLNQVEHLFLPFVYENYIGEDKDSVVELFSKNYKNPALANSLLNAQYSIFKVKRILKNGMDLFNLLNEKDYRVFTLTKMTDFRGIGVGQFIIARIIELQGTYFFIQIATVISSTDEDKAVDFAILSILKNPISAYIDNPEKTELIKNDISDLHKKFLDAFGSDEFLTLNTYTDDIIGGLSDSAQLQPQDYKDKAIQPDTYEFFDIDKSGIDIDSLVQKSAVGFSSDNKTYDVGIIVDKHRGLYVVPFYQTFCKIFEDKNSVVNAKKCVEFFLTNDSIPDIVLERVAKRYPNFIQVVNEFIKADYTLDSLIRHFKPLFKKYKMFSTTSVLFRSAIFELAIAKNSDSQQFQKVN